MRILILSNDHFYSSLALKNFFNRFHQHIVGLILPDFIIPGKSYLQSIRFLLKKSCFQFVFYKWFEAKLYKLKSLLGLSQLKPHSFYSKKYNFPIYKTTDINNQNTVNLIKKLKPDVIYSLAYPQKIGPAVINIPKKGCINFHDSILPKYRGLCAYFWITANNEKTGGVTAAYIDKNLDTGNIILQRRYPIYKHDTMQTVYYKNAKLMGKMILEIQSQLNHHQLKSSKQPQAGASYYSWPNQAGLRLFKQNQKKLFQLKQLWDSI